MRERIRNHLIIFLHIFLISIVVIGTGKILNKIIVETEAKRDFENKKEVFLSADFFDESKAVESDGFNFIPAFTKEKLVGYVVKAETPGFASNIKFIVGMDLEGKITGLNVLDASKETQGLGSKIQDETWEKLWINRDENYEFQKSIDGLSGATITPKSVFIGIKKILSAYDSIKPEIPIVVVSKEDIKSSIDLPIKIVYGNDKNLLSKIQKVFFHAKAYNRDTKVSKGVSFVIVYDFNDKILGYFTQLKAEGVDDKLSFDLGIDENGKIVKLTNINIGNNSPEYNKLIKSDKWQNNWIGRDETYSFNDGIDSQVGASVSPNAIYSSIKNALKAFKGIHQISEAVKLPEKNIKISYGTDKGILKKAKLIYSDVAYYDSNIKTEKGINYILLYDSKDNKLGYLTSLKADGVDDKLTFDLGIGMDGKVVKLFNVNIGNNSAGYNGLILSTDWQKKWIGRDKNYKFDESIDSQAGASISPNAIYSAIIKALKGFEKIKGGSK